MEFSKGDKVKVLPLTTDMFKAGTLIQELADTPIWRKTLEHVNWEGVVENADGHSSYVRFKSGEGCWTYNLALEKIKEKKYVLYRMKYGWEKERLNVHNSIEAAKYELYVNVKADVLQYLVDFRDEYVEFFDDGRKAVINSDKTYYIEEEEV